MFARWLRAAAAAALLWSAGAGLAFADRRVALVIGNAAYAKVDSLANTLNDAADIAGALERLGFTVARIDNGGFDAMRRGLRDFSRTSAGADVSIVYFAGHGIEMGGENYLIPVDAELARDTDVEHEAIALKSVTATVDSAKLLGLVILDACRNNPFAAKMVKSGAATRSIGRGLARVEPTGSVLVAFAAKEGTTAADGQGRNSPFTGSLLKHMETPDLEISFLFRNVRDDVVAATARIQEPFVYGSLSRNAIFLKKRPPVVTSAPVEAAPPPKPAAPLFTGDPGEACDRAATFENDARRIATIPPVPNAALDGQLIIAACTAARTRYPDEPRYDFLLGRGFFGVRNKDQFIEYMSRAARRGYGAASCAMGHQHEQGNFDRSLDRLAVQWFELAVQQGDHFCAFDLARLQNLGKGTERNVTRAAILLRFSADKGFRDAQFGLAAILEIGEGVGKDTAAARKYYEAAAAQGHADAMHSLALLLRIQARSEIGRSARLLLDAFKSGGDLARDSLTVNFLEKLDLDLRKAIEQELVTAGELRRAATGAFDAETQAALQRLLAPAAGTKG